MKVKVAYSKEEFEKTITYIAKNNKFFLGNHAEIRRSLLRSIASMIKNNIRFTATMGYYIRTVDIRHEGIDNDENYHHIQFLVDPSLGSNRDETEYVETIYDTNEEGSV